MRVALGTGGVCEPPPTPTCVDTAFADASGTCRRFGRACAADGWPIGLPTTGPLLYVDPSAVPGGNGQRDTPLRSLNTAVETAPANTVIALRAGEHIIEPLVLERPVELYGACAVGTTVSVATADEETPSISVLARVQIRDLTVTGDRPGLFVGRFREDWPEAQLSITAVIFENVVRLGIAAWPATTVTADELWIRRVAPRPSSGEAGTFVAFQASTAAIRNGVFEDGAGEGILGLDGAVIDLEDVAVRRVEPNRAGRGWALSVSTGVQVKSLRTVFEDVRDVAGFISDRSRLDATHWVTRDVSTVIVDDQPSGAGLYVTRNSEARVRGGVFRRQGPTAIFMFGPSSATALSDVWMNEINGVDGFYAISAGFGGRLDLDRVWIRGPSGVFISGDETTGSIHNLTTRSDSTTLFDDGFALLVTSGAGTVTATAIDVTGLRGVAVSSTASHARIRGIRVQHNETTSMAVYATEGGRLDVAELEVEGSTAAAVWADTNGLLVGEDLRLRTVSSGVVTTRGGNVQLDRVSVEAPLEYGLFLVGGNSRIEDLTIDRRQSDDRGFATARFAGGATVALSRATFSAVAGSGLVVTDGARATMEDIAFDAVEPAGDLDFGVYVAPNAVLSANRLALRNFGGGAIVDGQANLRHAFITGRPLATYGVAVGGRGQIVLETGLIERVTGFGTVMYGRGRLDGRDLVIEDVASTSDGVSVGMAAVENATIAVDRIRIVGTRTAGGLVGLAGRMVLRDAYIADAQAPACPLQACGVAGIASGLFLQDRGRIDLVDFEIYRADTAGILIADATEIDGRNGIIAECGFGVFNVNPDFDVARVIESVVFRDNQRDIILEDPDLPRIEVRTPGAPAGDGD